jgi:hypothetical protein
MEDGKSLIEFEGTSISVSLNNNEIEIEMAELAKALQYADIRVIKNLINSNRELLDKKFSYLKKVDSIENGVKKKREKRIFTEDGLYEVTMLANTEVSKKFRRRIRELIKAIRKKDLVLQAPVTSKQQLQLDEMVDLVKSRDQQIEELFGMIEEIKDTVEDIKLIKSNMEIIIQAQDEMGEAINTLIDEVYGKEDEEL